MSDHKSRNFVNEEDVGLFDFVAVEIVLPRVENPTAERTAIYKLFGCDPLALADTDVDLPAGRPIIDALEARRVIAISLRIVLKRTVHPLLVENIVFDHRAKVALVIEVIDCDRSGRLDARAFVRHKE